MYRFPHRLRCRLHGAVPCPWLQLQRYTYDISRPVGQRVAAMTVQGKPVADTDVFTICLNSYRASGTGGYDCYVGCPVVREIGTEMSDLILDYFKQYGDAMPERRGDFQVLPPMRSEG